MELSARITRFHGCLQLASSIRAIEVMDKTKILEIFYYALLKMKLKNFNILSHVCKTS